MPGAGSTVNTGNLRRLLNCTISSCIGRLLESTKGPVEDLVLVSFLLFKVGKQSSKNVMFLDFCKILGQDQLLKK